MMSTGASSANSADALVAPAHSPQPSTSYTPANEPQQDEKGSATTAHDTDVSS